MDLQAFLNIDIVDIETGEIIDIFTRVWIGDVQKIYNKYNPVKIDKFGDNRTVWVIV